MNDLKKKMLKKTLMSGPFGGGYMSTDDVLKSSDKVLQDTNQFLDQRDLEKKKVQEKMNQDLEEIKRKKKEIEGGY